jgi:hypothetical protein
LLNGELSLACEHFRADRKGGFAEDMPLTWHKSLRLVMNTEQQPS